MNSHNDQLPDGEQYFNWQSTEPVSQRSGFESRLRLNFLGFPFVTAQVTLINNCDDKPLNLILSAVQVNMASLY